MDRKNRELRLLLCVSDDATRRRLVNQLVELSQSQRLDLADCRLKVVRCTAPEEAMARVRHYAAAPAQPAVIVVSDCLVESAASSLEVDTWTPSNWAKEVRDELQGRGAMIALMDRPRRVRDVDRALSCTPTADELLAALQLVAAKLCYMAPPPKQKAQQPIAVRMIRRQHELMEYFKLRHRIYKVMGYLDEEIENAPSQMEIDWCDTISLHIGAFEQMRSARERLVGTARVVVGSASCEQRMPKLLAAYQRWVGRLSEPDPVLRKALTRVLELELPIFHSQNLRDVFRDVLQRDEMCGELSRVIVDEDHRGTGLSSRLVEFALAEAARSGVQRLFLECLELHEGLYRKFGFGRLAAAPSPVLSVNATMVSMELYPVPGSRSRPIPAAKGVAGETAHV
jgi:GNAT superfamily N-acetyltransferase